MYASSLGLYPFAEELSTTLTPYCPVDKSLWAPTSTHYVPVLDAVNTPAPNPAMPITELKPGPLSASDTIMVPGLSAYERLTL